MPYVTVTQVDETLGGDWADPAAKPLAVQMANTWLSARQIPEKLSLEDQQAVTLAGSYLSKMAADGTLYADSEGVIKREKVKADTVEVDTEFADGSRPVLADMTFVTDLLSKFLSANSFQFKLSRG